VLLGALILQSKSLTQSRMDATARGLDRKARFAEVQEIDSDLTARLPPTAIGIMFTPTQGHELLDYLEEKVRPAEQCDALKTTKPPWGNNRAPESGPTAPSMKPRAPSRKRA
jgi:hypothetical protein